MELQKSHEPTSVKKLYDPYLGKWVSIKDVTVLRLALLYPLPTLLVIFSVIAGVNWLV